MLTDFSWLALGQCTKLWSVNHKYFTIKSHNTAHTMQMKTKPSPTKCLEITIFWRHKDLHICLFARICDTQNLTRSLKLFHSFQFIIIKRLIFYFENLKLFEQAARRRERNYVLEESFQTTQRQHNAILTTHKTGNRWNKAHTHTHSHTSISHIHHKHETMIHRAKGKLLYLLVHYISSPFR